MSMSLRSGTITAINGLMATVRVRSGRTYELPLRRLHAIGAPNEIGAVVSAIRSSVR